MSLAEVVDTGNMRINPNTAPSDVAKLASRPKAIGAAETSSLGTDKAALSASEAVDEAWQRLAAARPEKVAQARALLSSDVYPSEAQLGKVAGLLAKHLSR